ncbi:hypothetical protein SNEBB_003464 [Seison nebaliae]|nr:hypothetical protein SNEBB_003464 [Seison nebaliae]
MSETLSSSDPATDQQQQQQYYCYQCERSFVHRPRNAEGNENRLECPQCKGEFIEEVPNRTNEDFLVNSVQAHIDSGMHLSNVVRLMTDFISNPGPMPGNGSFQIQMVGRPEGSDLQNLLTHFLNVYEGNGSPPARQADLNKLQTEKVTQEIVDQKTQCSICMDDLKIDSTVKKLPCGHYFHEDCIMPWLRLHDTCPVCRESLAEDSPPPQQQPGNDLLLNFNNFAENLLFPFSPSQTNENNPNSTSSPINAFFPDSARSAPATTNLGSRPNNSTQSQPSNNDTTESRNRIEDFDDLD